MPMDTYSPHQHHDTQPIALTAQTPVELSVGVPVFVVIDAVNAMEDKLE